MMLGRSIQRMSLGCVLSFALHAVIAVVFYQSSLRMKSAVTTSMMTRSTTIPMAFCFELDAQKNTPHIAKTCSVPRAQRRSMTPKKAQSFKKVRQQPASHPSACQSQENQGMQGDRDRVSKSLEFSNGAAEALYAPQPTYPPLARRRKIEGHVLLRLEVDEEGRVIRAHLLEKSVHDSLNRAAMEALTQWRFSKASVKGQKRFYRVPITFSLININR